MIEHLKATGFGRYDVHTAATSQWDIPRPMRKCFDSYFILHWDGEFCRGRIKTGIIQKDGINYNVVFTKGVTPTKLVSGTQFRLSFRKPIREFQLPGFVLIAPMRSSD